MEHIGIDLGSKESQSVFARLMGNSSESVAAARIDWWRCSKAREQWPRSSQT